MPQLERWGNLPEACVTSTPDWRDHLAVYRKHRKTRYAGFCIARTKADTASRSALSQ